MIKLPSLEETELPSGWRLFREWSNHLKIAACTIDLPVQGGAVSRYLASSRLADKPKGNGVLSDPDRLGVITDQYAQGGQGWRARFGPTHAMTLLAAGGDLMVGAFHGAAAVA